MSTRRIDQYPDRRCEGMTFMFLPAISIANLPQYASFCSARITISHPLNHGKVPERGRGSYQSPCMRMYDPC